MPERQILTPGPDHPIAIEQQDGRVVVRFAGQVIADTQNALILREARYPAVFYVPRQDADMTLLERTATSTYCPYKGDASYFTIAVGDRRSADAIWSYEAPHIAVTAIADHLAFYPDRVDSIEASAG